MAKTIVIPKGSAPPLAPYSPGIRAGNAVYVSGMVAMDSEGKTIGVGDARTQTRAVLEAIKDKARHVEVQKKSLELDIATRNESIARLRTQQYETRKNDEFQAMGHEIERYEKEIVQLEDQELELMEQADKLRAEIATAEKTASAGRDSVNRQLADLEEKTKTLQTQLEELKNERVQLAQNIDEDVRERYERLFASKGDAAVVAVEHGVCTGCHMKVTAATAVHAKSGNEIVSCEQCGRILYVAE